MTQLLEAWKTYLADAYLGGFVQVGHLIHVVLGAGIADADRTCHTCAGGLCGDEASGVGRSDLLLDGPVEVEVGLHLGRLLLRELLLELQSGPREGVPTTVGLGEDTVTTAGDS